MHVVYILSDYLELFLYLLPILTLGFDNSILNFMKEGKVFRDTKENSICDVCKFL